MQKKTLTPKIATFMSILALAGACSQETSNQGKSSLKADGYYNAGTFKQMFFEAACDQIQRDAAAPATYKQTLDVLFQKAKALDASITTCALLQNAFEGRKLDLKGVGNFLELGLVAKVFKPKVVDISFNDLTDESLSEFGGVPTLGTPGNWELSVTNIDASYNKFTKVGDFFRSRDGYRQLDAIEQVNLEGNAITTLDDIPDSDIVFKNLKTLNISKNPLKLTPSADGLTPNHDVNGYRFFIENSFTYLDISNTGISSTAIFAANGNPNLLMLNLDGLTLTDTTVSKGDLLFPKLIYASARGSKGLPGDFFGHSIGSGPAAPQLSFLDLSGSDVASISTLSHLPELDILLMAQTKVTDFSSIPTAATALDVLSVYKTGVTAAINFPTLGLLDAQATALVPGSTYVTVKESCSGPKCMVGPATEDRTMVATDFALCPKSQRLADGKCAIPVGTCDGPITQTYDANNLLVEMCCTTTSPIVMGELSVAPTAGKICASDLGELGIYK